MWLIINLPTHHLDLERAAMRRFGTGNGVRQSDSETGLTDLALDSR